MIDSFLNYMTIQGKSKDTLRTYRNTLERIQELFPEFSKKSGTILRATLPELIQGAPATYNKNLSILRMYFEYLVLVGERPDNPISALKNAKSPMRSPEVIDNSMVTHIFSHKDRSSYDKRDTAILSIFLATGLRVSELVSLNTTTFVGDRGRIVGKGGKERTVFLDDRAIHYLGIWKKARKSLITYDDALFVSQYGTRITDTLVQQMVRDRTGGQAHPHLLRHTAATQWVKRGLDLESVRILLGHSSLKTTQRYLNLSIDYVGEQYRKIMNEESWKS